MDIYLRNPFKLSFDIQEDGDAQQRYRLIDPPLARYILGITRIIVHTPTIKNDWDWAKNWEENQKTGTLPNDELLQIGRTAMAVLLIISTFFLYISSSSIGSRTSGLLAALLLGINALALLHGRRAMAEGILIFGITLFLVSLIYSSKYPWLTGLAVAVAINAKHLTFPLFFVGFLSVCWFIEKVENKKFMIIKNIILYLGIFFLVTLVLNPIYWNQPFEALKASLDTRQDLLSLQVNDMQSIMPERVLASLPDRFIALLANLFILRPSVADIGNYLTDTIVSERIYFSYPTNNLFRGFIGGGIMMTLTIVGLIFANFKALSSNAPLSRLIYLFILAFIFQLIGLLFFIPLPWQRYVIPLVPFVCLWTGLGIAEFTNLIKQYARKQKTFPLDGK